MNLADAVVNEALEYDGAIDDANDATIMTAADGSQMRRNWDAFQTFFQVIPGWVWTPAKIRQAKTRWKYITDSGGDGGSKVHWCGIFAAWAMRQAGCPVSWHGDNGIFWGHKLMPFLHLTKNDPHYLKNRQAVKRGDVCVKSHVTYTEDPKTHQKVPSYFSHYMIVIWKEANGVRVVEGNSTAGQAIRTSHTYSFDDLTLVHPLPVSPDPMTALLGRWEVHIGVWTWNYLFLRHGWVYYTDIKDPNLVLDYGHWRLTSDAIAIQWHKTGTAEHWWLPIVPANQRGLCFGQGQVRADKLESEATLRTEKLRFAYE